MPGYSLHIGLNFVDPDCYDGWDGALSGCINDANSMEQLAHAQGFTPNKLIDGDATSHAVVGEISLLAQQAMPGDLCLITYSGHGGQVDDNNADETDLQDETWVLYDRQLVDDELYQLWSQFRAGVRLLVFSDSCHSGTVVKSMLGKALRQGLVERSSKSRPGPGEMPVTADVPKNMPVEVQRADNEKRRGTYQFVQSLSGPKSNADIRAGLILISGCQDNQLSFDGAVNGQFTGTLLQVWANGSFRGDHPAFHRAILDRMPPDQSPNLMTVGMADPSFLGQKPFTIATAAAPTPTPTPIPTPTPTPSSRPTLRQGATGSDVVYLQQRLIVHGYELNPDGDFGRMTGLAVRSFQADQALSPDGVVGPMTWARLETAPTGGSTPAVDSGGTAHGGNGAGSDGTPSDGGVAVAARPTIRRGSTGDHVTYLQGRLADLDYSVTIDGVFGPGTESAVRSFQRGNSLAADGIVGTQTWELLG